MNGESLQQTLNVVSAWQGMPLNFTTIGKQLGISRPAAKAGVLDLVRARLARLLPPLPLAERKSPKLYLTQAAESLPSSLPGRPDPEIQFRGRMIGTICSLETERNRSSTFWYYGGYGRTHVELIVQTPLKRIGFVFLQETRLSRWCWSYCKGILKRGIIQGAFVLYHRPRIFFVADRMVVLPAVEFLQRYKPWMNACLGSSGRLLLRLVREYNAARAERTAWP